MTNYVVCPTRLDSRGKGVNTDKTDALELVVRLDRYVAGNKKAFSVVRVPTPEQEIKRVVSRRRDQLRRKRLSFAAQGRMLLLGQGYRQSNTWWQGLQWLSLRKQLPDWLSSALETFQRIILELANIVLNHLDWQLQERGYHFVRYADDFVVLTQTKAQAEEALPFIAQTLEKLGLKLSPDKTRITTYKGGYSFLGFVLSRRSRRMRPKSVQKFQDKVRELTPRHHNLDASVIEKLNQVIRGTALYFTPPWATTRWQLGRLEAWLRMRLRAMWSKRKRLTDNYRLRNRKLAQLGLLSLTSFCPNPTP